jgi:nicotinamide-nucleotide amidase
MNTTPLPVPLLEPLAVLAARVGETLRARGQTVSVVESSAGGLVSAALLAVPGASAYFRGGAVVYSRRAGRALLGLSAEDMTGLRGETEPYARLVAGRVRDQARIGHVCLAIVGAVTVSRTIENGDTDRPKNKEVFARQLLALFDETLRAQETSA